RDSGVLENGGDAAAGPQAAHQPADRDPPQPRRDVAVAAEPPRFLPDGDEGVLNRVRHQVPVVAPPGKPDREPPGVALVQRPESAHVAPGHSGKQALVVRAAVHALTVASPARKRFTPQPEISGQSGNCRLISSAFPPYRRAPSPVSHETDATFVSSTSQVTLVSPR